MLILITGVPGSGKTLYSIDLIKAYLKEGRPVYADIEGLILEGVQPAPDDWRETPDGSVVVYDECQRRFGSEGARGGRSDKAEIAAMETHRHTGHDIILITQHPNLLHAHVRRLVGRHHHVFRLFGTKTAKVFTHDRLIKVDNRTDLQEADERIWSYPTQNFKHYKSATVHTHKARLPRYVYVGAAVMSALAIAVAFAFSQSALFEPLRGGSQERIENPIIAAVDNRHVPVQVVSEPPRPIAGVPMANSQPELVREVGGCAATWDHCQCYDWDLQPIVMTNRQCRETLGRPIFRPASVTSRKRGEAER